MAQAKIYKNLIGGEWVESRTGKTFENQNPADTRDLVGIFQASGKQDVDDAVEAARIAFEDRKSTRLNSSHIQKSRMPSSA